MENTNRSGKYDDIIELEHHVSKKRKKMSMHDRAAQFSPFSALSGYSEKIQETGRRLERKRLKTEDEKADLSEKLQYLCEISEDKPHVTIQYFVEDKSKKGGNYITEDCFVLSVARNEKCLVLTNGKKVYFDDIYSIDSEAFDYVGFIW